MDLLLLLALLGTSAFFSGSETAFFSLGAAERARLASTHGRAGRRVDDLLRRSHDLLSALLIGNLLVNTAASIVATGICVRLFGTRGVVVAVPAVTLALLVFGEITPKMLALRFRARVAVLAQAPLAVWVVITGPALHLIGAGVEGILRLLRLERTGTRPLTTDELQAACDLAVDDGTLTESEGRSLARLLLLEELEVRRVMTPRTEVVALRRADSRAVILEHARRAGFNRYPVLEEEGQRPAGLFHLKDLIGGDPTDEAPLAGELRPVVFVPESKDVAALLADMRTGGYHLAAVVDEHGDFTGIVTMADCLQALMGPSAESGQGTDVVIPLGDGRWVVGGRTDLRELEEATGLVLPPHRDYVTVAGFVMARLGRVLQPGDRVTLPEARLTVLEMTGLRVNSIQVTTLPGDKEVAP